MEDRFVDMDLRKDRLARARYFGSKRLSDWIRKPTFQNQNGGYANRDRQQMLWGTLICDPKPRNESLCAFEKSEKNGKVYMIVYMMYFVKIDQLQYPRYDNCTPNML
jgi:hypothetical protein